MDIIENSTTRGPQRVIIYGAPGVGKTQLALAFPSPVFLCAEEGLGTRRASRFAGRAETYAQIREAMKQLYRDEHNFRTLVLDSIDWAMPALTTEGCTRHGCKSMDDAAASAYGRGNAWARDVLSELLRMTDAVLQHRGMNVVLLAHAAAVDARDPGGEKYTAWGLGLQRLCAQLLTEWADEIWFLATDVCARPEDSKTHERLGYGTSDRIVHVAPNPAWLAKTRSLDGENYNCGSDKGFAAIMREFAGE